MILAWRTKSLTGAGVRFSRKPEARQRHAGEPYAEFLQRRAARDRLSHALGEFIEFVVHTSLSFGLLACFLDSRNWNPSFRLRSNAAEIRAVGIRARRLGEDRHEVVAC